MIGRFAGAVLIRSVRRAPPSAWVGLFVLALVAVVAILSPLFGHPVGADVDPMARSLPASAVHWLGTDHIGRDVLPRLLLASRSAVFPGMLACAFAVALGVPLGALAGWTRGVAAQVLRTAISSLSAVPRVVLVLLACATLGNTPLTLAFAAGLAFAPAIATSVAERVERLRLDDFVLAASAHGLSQARILWVHLVLAANGRTMARLSFECLAAFVALESALSYLGGFGVQEPTPSWGNMLAFERGRGLTVSVLAPGIALWATIGACLFASRLFAEVEDG